MKHLRFINLIIVMLLLVAWAPAPAALSTAPQSPAYALAAPVLKSPASGLLLPNYLPEFAWAPPAGYTPDSYTLQIAFNSTFTNEVAQIDAIPHAPDAGTGWIEFTPSDPLPSNAMLYWRVWAVKDSVNSTRSSSRTVKTAPEQVPGTLRPDGGETVTSLRPKLEWEAANRVTKYDVQILLDGVVKKIIPLGNVTEYTLTYDLVRGGNYQWQVRSHGLYANTAWYPASPNAFTAPNPPSVPTLSSPASGFVVDTFTPTFDWTDSVSPTNLDLTYILDLSTDAKFQTLYNEIETTVANQSQYTLQAGEALVTGTYYWRVRAKDSNGALSNWSASRTVKTLPHLRIQVIDQMSGDGVPGATVTLTNVPGSPFTTDDEGWVEGLPATVSAGSKSFAVTKGTDYIRKTGSISATNGVDRLTTIALVHIPIKVVITWGTAQDLDLHTWIPQDANWNEDRGHVRWNWPGTIFTKPYVRLNNDDMNGYGPETITIQNRYPGRYVIAVFKDAGWSISSGAKAKIYKNGVLIKTANNKDFLEAPTGNGTWWYLYDIDGTTGDITTISQIRTASPGTYDPDGGTFALNK